MSKSSVKDSKIVEVRSRSELRRWLQKNHKQKDSIWLVTYKQVRPEYCVDYDAIVEEALCFGWIDSQPKLLDSERKMIRLSPRRPGSGWSKRNRERVQKLISENKMRAAGLAKVKDARKDGSWAKLSASDALKVPPDLKKAFQEYSKAAEYFGQFPPSVKRAILEWILQAKRAETRQRRVQQVAQLAQRNIRANQWRPKR